MNPLPEKPTSSPDSLPRNAYWHANLRIIAQILLIWFVVSFGFGILLVDWLNMITVGGYKLGFWFAQQGSMYTFVLLVIYYSRKMVALDRKFEANQDDPPPP